MNAVDLADAIVVGGGPAGLSAALLLGRCHRTVLVFDDGRPRNWAATQVHNYLGLENASPADLIAIGRRQLLQHPNVSLFDQRVTSVRRVGDEFRATAASGMEFRSRGLVLATGLIDQLPRIENLDGFFGRTAHTCAYCDGWESTDQEIVVWGSGDEGAEVALEMLLWSPTIALVVNGAAPSKELTYRLNEACIPIHFSTSATAIGNDGNLDALLLSGGRRIPCRRLFLAAPQSQPNDFVQSLGCELTDGAQANCKDDVRTEVEGLFIAGNAGEGIELSMVAAADGLKAAAALNDWLLNQTSKPN